MARHKWDQHTSIATKQKCGACGVVRGMFFPVGGPRAQWVYEWPSGEYDVRDDSERVPPCPGAPESKKEETR